MFKRVKLKIHKCNPWYLPTVFKSTKVSLKQSDVNKKVEDECRNYCSFANLIESRKKEAERSILVQVHSEHSCSDLEEYCNQFGTVKSLHHYTLSESLHYVLVEFLNEADVKNILKTSLHIDGSQVVPVRSPFFWFRAAEKSKKKKSVLKSNDVSKSIIKMNCDLNISKESLDNWMLEAQSVSDQMLILHRSTKLVELGTRLRFLTAHQLELAFKGLFPEVQALPFGSTVNGFGRMSCDLDLVLQLDKEETKEDASSRLIFHAKTSLANERTQAQRYMETIGDIFHLFLPGCSKVIRILHARVPIIKYRQDLTGVECDVSMTNMSAVHMSELLYVFSQVDPRVQPLVFAVRHWAREVGLTHTTPGSWITNFSLTLLVLFFLQQPKPAPVLPTINTLIALSGSKDCRMTSNGVNCTFIRDINKLKQYMASQSTNHESLETLLLRFFEFYSVFDFSTQAVSLANGVSISKPDHFPLYIANPLEHGLNVSKNVNKEETERLRIEFRNASWALELGHKHSGKKPWGLLAIFQASQSPKKGRNPFYFPAKNVINNRLVEVSELFHEKEDIPLKPLKNKSSVEKVSDVKNTKNLPKQTVVRTKTVKTSRRRK